MDGDTLVKLIFEINKQLKHKKASIYFICITGSESYGYPSVPKNDIDIAGTFYYRDMNKIFNIPNIKSQTVEGSAEINGLKYDWQLQEVFKFLHLLKKANMNVLDSVFSEWILYPKAHFNYSKKEFRELAHKCIYKGTVNHALGWSKTMYQMGWHNPKKALHCLRPLLVMINYIYYNEYVLDITKLAQQIPINAWSDVIEGLVELKQLGHATTEIVRKRALEMYDDCMQTLKDLEDKLPEKNDMREKIESVVTSIRLDTIQN